MSAATSRWAPAEPIRAVLFDIDDTLIDFRASAAAGLAALLGEAGQRPGLPALWHELTERHYPRFLAGKVSFHDMQLERLAEIVAWAGLPEVDHEGLTALEVRRQEAMTANYCLFDDVLDCLDGLQGVPVGVLSNSDGPHQRAKLASVGLDRRFDVVVISGEVGHPKPDPRIFLEGCRQLGQEPAAVAYVGDRFDVDATAATAAGLLGIWLDRAGLSSAAEAPDRDPTIPIITGLTELRGLLSSP